MRKLLLIATLFFFYLSNPTLPDVSFQGKIYPANNEDYKELLLSRLKESKKNIQVIMFLASYYTNPRYKETSPTNLFIKELIEAKKRGLNVEVILNADSDYSSHATSENLKTGAYLSEKGISVYFDSPGKTTHAKLLVIDEKLVVIGSANWSYSAMANNNEASVIIESSELAKFYIKYFEEIKKESRIFLLPVTEK